MGPALSSCCWRLHKTPPRPDEGRALSVLLSPPRLGSQSSEVLQQLQQFPAWCWVCCLCRRSPGEVSTAPWGSLLLAASYQELLSSTAQGFGDAISQNR